MNRKILKSLVYNWKTLLGFEILYKLLTAVIFVPFFKALLNGAMKISGYHYLTLENLASFLKNGVTAVTLLAIAVIIAILILADISGIVFILDNSRRRVRISIYQTIIFAYRNTCRGLKGKNSLFLLLLVLLIPFLNIGVIPSYVSTVSIPGFVRTYIRTHQKTVLLCGVFWITLTALLLRELYAFHYFTLEQDDFREAIRKSRKLIRGEWIRDIVFLLLLQIVFYLCFIVFAVIGIVLVLLFGKICAELKLINVMATSAIWCLIFVIFSIVFAISTPVSYGMVSLLFYSHKKKKKEAMPEPAAPPQPQSAGSRRRILAAQGILFVVGLFGYVYLVYQNSVEKTDIQIEYLRTMEVTAHRGASLFYPENTMAAFTAAVEQGADWIELDVQQSKDGKIFVMHDRNFKRTTGVDKYSWELTYDEIRRLDAGALFGNSHKGERIPLLEDVIAFAKENGVRLNIELKPAGFETEFEKTVVDIVCGMEFQDQCVLTSQQYQTLVNIKEYNEEIPTVYVMSFAYGNVNRLTAADSFSMETSSVTPRMVSRVHNAGKQIYAWTVNSRNNMNRMIDLNVDNIITDNVLLAQKCIYESKTSDVIQKFIRFLKRY